MLKITFFFVFYFAIILIYEVISGKKQKVHHTAGYWVLKAAFYIYVLLLVKVTIFPIPFQKSELEGLRRSFGEGFGMNFIPMKSIMNIANSNVNLSTKFRQIAGNFILLFPLGLYLPLAKDRFRKAKEVFALLLISACFIEMVQFLIGRIIHYNYRVVDIDDVILNVCGGIVGFFVWKIANKYFAKIEMTYKSN